MVVGGRIAYLRALVADGFVVHCAFSFCALSGKRKVKVHVGAAADVVPVLQRGACGRAIDLIQDWCADAVVVDRGHRFSSGESQVCF